MTDLKCYAGKCAHGLTVICLSTLAGILAPLIFMLVMIIVESFQPGYNPIQDLISELALGLYGRFQTLSFFLIGFLFSVFTFRLYITMLKRTTTVVGTTFFSLSSLGFFLLGAFPMDPGGVGLVMPGLVHSVAATEVVSSFILGCFAFAVYFRADSRWNRFWLYTVLTAIACLMLSLLWVVTPLEWQWKGLGQRLAVVIGFLWVEIVSVRLLMSCIRKEPK